MIHDTRKPDTNHDYYLDDLKPGDAFSSPSVILSEQDVIEFAEKYDPQPFHLDRDAAKSSHFGGLVAGGFQTAALAWALAQRTGVFRKCSLAGIGIDGLHWRKPVWAGDALTCRFELLKKRMSSSRPGQGIAVWRFDVFNQHDEIVLTMQMTQLLKCRES
jgi:acyl dehydratase